MKKIFNIKKAIEQFVYRLQHGKFEPNQNDVEALKFIVDWINREKEKSLKNEVLFAKLFCLVFAQEVKFYEGNFKLAQSKMHDYLKHPINHYYDIFIKEINDVETNKFIKSIGIEQKHPALFSDEEKNSQDKIVEDNQEEILKYFNGIYESDKVYTSLNNTITEFINLYKNKP